MRPERWLRLLLRVVGTASLLAIPFVMVPYAWMNTIHQALGMGGLPADPIVGYLARSTSAFYALFGGLLWVVSLDLQRHRPVLSYLRVANILFGVASLGFNLLEGIPLWWTATEGPFKVGFGVLILVLTRRLREAPRDG